MTPEQEEEARKIISQELSRLLGGKKEDKNIFPRDYILNKFEPLKKEIIDLLTEDYKFYIENIYVVAPKPTTFRIIFKNGQKFYLIYEGKTFTAKIEGKKYYLLNLNEKQQAIKSLASMLETGPIVVNQVPGDISTENEFDKNVGPGLSGPPVNIPNEFPTELPPETNSEIPNPEEENPPLPK